MNLSLGQIKKKCSSLARALGKTVLEAGRILDKDKSGTIDEDEFFKWWFRDDLKEQQSKDVKGMFEQADKNGDGSLCVDEVGELLQKLGVKGAPEKASKLSEILDVDKDGKVSKSEFMKFVFKMPAGGGS